MGEVVTWSGAALRRQQAAEFEVFAGRTRPGGSTPSPRTRFQGGSVSKTILAVTALHLVEHGVLDLAMPIARWLGSGPGWLAQVSLHQLLTHTAGLGHWRDMPEWDMADPPGPEAMLAGIFAAPRPHPAGVFAYSNFGYLVAAAVIQAATNTAYATAASEAVLRPAGMRDTTSGEFPIDDEDCAVGFHDGRPLQVSATPTSVPGMGDIWTTTHDLMRFSRALRRGDLLGPELNRTLVAKQVALPNPVTLADDRITADGYGYGAWIARLGGVSALVMPGDNVGYRSLVVQVRGTDDDVVVLTNDDGPTLQAPLDLVLR